MLRAARLRALRNDDSGDMLVLLVVAVALLVAVALAFLVPIGAAVVDRRTASTAADSAALAAVDAWRGELEDLHARLLTTADADTFWDSLGHDLGWYRPTGMTTAAERYASRNDSVLLSYAASASAGTVSVRVRSKERVPGTHEYVHSSATAALVLERGLCLDRGRVGIVIAGTCATSPDDVSQPEPPPPADDDADDDADGAADENDDEPPSDPPFTLPEHTDTLLKIRTRLIAAP